MPILLDCCECQQLLDPKSTLSSVRWGLLRNQQNLQTYLVLGFEKSPGSKRDFRGNWFF